MDSTEAVDTQENTDEEIQEVLRVVPARTQQQMIIHNDQLQEISNSQVGKQHSNTHKSGETTGALTTPEESDAGQQQTEMGATINNEYNDRNTDDQSEVDQELDTVASNEVMNNDSKIREPNQILEHETTGDATGNTANSENKRYLSADPRGDGNDCHKKWQKISP